MKNILLSILLIISLASCAKYMDNQQANAGDSAAIADSLSKLNTKPLTRENLSGVWMRMLATQKAEEGYNLKADGRLALLNFYTMHGDHWQLSGDTLYFYKYTDQDTIAKPSLARVLTLNDSTMVIAPIGAPSGYTETYHRRTINLSKRFSEVFHKQFMGKLQPFQIIDHPFELTTILKGAITLNSPNNHIRFSIKKDGILINEKPVTKWVGDFPPGKYVINVFYPNPSPNAKTTETAEYVVVVSEE